MSTPKHIWEENPLKKIAEASLEKPGMYLIALRAHLNKGKTAIDDMIDTVSESLPHPARFQKADEA